MRLLVSLSTSAALKQLRLNGLEITGPLEKVSYSEVFCVSKRNGATIKPLSV